PGFFFHKVNTSKEAVDETGPPLGKTISSSSLSILQRGKPNFGVGSQVVSLDLESTSSASPWPTGSNRDDVLNALAELCCGLSELITAPSYAGVSIQ
ncbi:hypothetical protein P7K49_024032, partial [Saguinus oedipus]